MTKDMKKIRIFVAALAIVFIIAVVGIVSINSNSEYLLYPGDKISFSKSGYNLSCVRNAVENNIGLIIFSFYVFYMINEVLEE